MSGRLPVEIDAVRCADQARRVQGYVPLSAFKRLAAWLDGSAGQLAFDLAFARGDDDRRWLHGHVTGTVDLRCQRCLESFALPLERAFDLVLVSDEAEAERLPEALEPVVIGSAHTVRTVDLVEDELILALPLIPRCEVVRDCQPGVELLESERIEEMLEAPKQRPFAGLDKSKPGGEPD